MSIIKTLLLLSLLTLSPLTHALEEALGTPTTVSPSPSSVPIAQADPATLLEAALQLREAKPALFAGAEGVLIVKPGRVGKCLFVHQSSTWWATINLLPTRLDYLIT